MNRWHSFRRVCVSYRNVVKPVDVVDELMLDRLNIFKRKSLFHSDIVGGGCLSLCFPIIHSSERN